MRFRVGIDGERCKACSLCVVSCPQGVVQMSKTPNAKGQKYAAVVKPDDCTGCQSCAVMCPEAIVTVDRHADSVSAEPGAGSTVSPTATRPDKPRRTGRTAGIARIGEPPPGARSAEGP